MSKFQQTAFARCGVIGPVDSVTQLEKGITRTRPRGSGSRRELAQRLHDKLTELAQRRWASACKGQRRPTPAQAARFAAEIRDAVSEANGRCTERTLTAQDAIRVARRADRCGTDSMDGGRITTSSYKYRWTTTTVSARRMPDGTVRVRVARTGTAGESGTVIAPARWWRDIALSSEVLKFSGASYGIRNGDSWKVYDNAGSPIGVAVPMPADLVDHYGSYEHGTDLDTCHAEIEHKRRVLAERRSEQERTARENAKRERRAGLLARLGKQTNVTYWDARACGMCEQGIRQFAHRIGIADPTNATIPLATVYQHEPAYALKLARHLLQKAGR